MTRWTLHRSLLQLDLQFVRGSLLILEHDRGQWLGHLYVEIGSRTIEKCVQIVIVDFT